MEGISSQCDCVVAQTHPEHARCDEIFQAGKDGPGGWLRLADRYGGLVKPDIVFFGEQACCPNPRWDLRGVPSTVRRFADAVTRAFFSIGGGGFSAV